MTNPTQEKTPDLATTELAEHVADIGRAMAGGRWDDVFGAISPDVVAHVPAVGELHGFDALATFLLDTAAKTDDGEHIELIDSMVGDTHAALYFRITATRAGRPPLDNLTVHLARLEGRVIQEIWFHNFDGPAVADFWA